MEIWRQGANRRTGWTVIRSKKAAIFTVEREEKKPSVVDITLKTTSDPNQVGQYDHAVRLSFDDVAKILEELSEVTDPQIQLELAEKLENYVRPLNRLLLLASGVSIAR